MNVKRSERTMAIDPPVRVLMGPGPSDVNPRVLEAMARPTIGHLDPQFLQVLNEIREMLQKAGLPSSPWSCLRGELARHGDPRRSSAAGLSGLIHL